MTITAEDFAKLDEAATQGTLILDEYAPGAAVITNEDGIYFADESGHPDFPAKSSHLIAALVNAYRSGQLVHVDEVEKLREALRSTRDEARKIRANPDKIFSVAVDALGDSHE